MKIYDFLAISKGSYLFIKKNPIYSGFYLRNCLLFTKFRFLARTANKTCLNSFLKIMLNFSGFIELVCRLITLCMKLPWFCHTNGGQLVCNCPRSRPLFWRETDVLSLCCCLRMAENSVSWLCRTKILQLLHKHRLLRASQNNNELEEQCIHHFNLIKYLVE